MLCNNPNSTCDNTLLSSLKSTESPYIIYTITYNNKIVDCSISKWKSPYIHACTPTDTAYVVVAPCYVRLCIINYHSPITMYDVRNRVRAGSSVWTVVLLACVGPWPLGSDLGHWRISEWQCCLLCVKYRRGDQGNGGGMCV